ncbi:hypothetical protein LX64_00286 [Chitinophaga skermanii]|uniref:Uncharacterized protein n=1 Tax=Chitinophaga skermanii TaxID=331697 RepID=A0A327R1Y4_9BACT|nr:hypothetical protein [Chitinophaga skermanii]RAJ10680.1 hypothetical protein LX64_00286 [Chitinophaga skermanii]
MNYPINDNTDILIRLNRNDSVTLLFHIADNIYEIRSLVSIDDTMPLLMGTMHSLLEGKDDFVWSFCNYDEWNHIYIKRKPHQPELLIIESKESGSREPFSTIFQFEVEQKQFLLTLYYQLKKIAHLMTNEVYAEDRKAAFSIDTFQALQAALHASYPQDVVLGLF